MTLTVSGLWAQQPLVDARADNGAAGCRFGDMQSKLLEQRDRRVAVVHEMLQARLSHETLSSIRAAISRLQILRLQAMGTLKVYGWESVFAERIHQLRLQVSCVWCSVLLHKRCMVSWASGGMD